ncbi:bidirectional sugar transporter NEC1-like isoform X2 [Salvia hispanica]|uniref:bidirectional sugar transporter NEC1-like isoform X2 n=1 Tax=Salvia hispanica TaxID=49212 RepID=UPI0020091969|nr:bidirectional sugar transporter NEC1-like isoform X2 [Salvia hispanica]
MAPNMANAFGILGNVVSFLVYLAPVPTFRSIFKKKSTEGFQAIPYAVALFSAMLYLYYAFLKKNGTMLITINTFGCTIEVVYLAIYMIYATKESRVFTTKLILLLNVISLGLITLCTYYFAHGHLRVNIVGWICAVFSVAVFVAPLSIMRQVVRTKSVEYMPFTLSCFLTLCAVVWFFYGFLIKDYYIATPNILGFVFGLAQMMLYLVYKNDSMCWNQQIQPAEGDSSKDGDDNHHQDKSSSNNQEVEVVVVN